MPIHIREAIMATAKEILDLGADDPEMISIMGFLEEDVGPDTISDFTTRVVMPDLAQKDYVGVLQNLATCAGSVLDCDDNAAALHPSDTS